MILASEHFDREIEEPRRVHKFRIISVEGSGKSRPSWLMLNAVIEYCPAFPRAVETGRVAESCIQGMTGWVSPIVDVAGNPLRELTLLARY